MSDFTSGFWGGYVALLTLLSIAFCAFILIRMSQRRVASDPDKTGHVWDEDLDEYNNPLPRWWVWLFWITIVFAFAYLALYPGLGRRTRCYLTHSVNDHLLVHRPYKIKSGSENPLRSNPAVSSKRRY